MRVPFYSLEGPESYGASASAAADAGILMSTCMPLIGIVKINGLAAAGRQAKVHE